MLAQCDNHLFSRAVHHGKLALRALTEREEVKIDCVPLKHGSITGITISGIGASETVPAVYRAWSGDNLAGGVYNHPRIPGWYISDAFETGFKTLRIYAVVVSCFEGVIDLNSSREVLRAIWHIHV